MPEVSKNQMNELDIANAIASGQIESPQQYGSMWLYSMRVTGTGFAYREKDNEFCYRNPDNYLNEDFLTRCQGLPVIWYHPENQTLDTSEFIKRAIGSIMFAYILDQEVWCIARVYDESAVNEMSNAQLSTSPCVVTSNDLLTNLNNADSKILNECDKINECDNITSQPLLIEGLPVLLDHLAVCKLGVWDKGGEPLGINTNQTVRLDSMDEPINPEASPAPEKTTTSLDDLAQLMHGLHAKHDDLAQRVANLESGEQKEAAGHEAAAETLGDPELNADPVNPIADNETDMSRNIAQADDSCDDDDKLAKADSAIKDLKKELESLKARLPRNLSHAELNEISAIQAKADSIYYIRGDKAPQPMPGEQPLSYKNRILNALKRYSKQWSGVDLSVLPSSALSVVEAQIYADAGHLDMSEMPSTGLREIRRRSETGHEMIEFVGDPNEWLKRSKPRTISRRGKN